MHFYREGYDWGHVGISESINQDVRDFKTLRLQLDVLVSNQDLYNCGDAGSECPVMVQIAYVDISGRQRNWMKGFFYNFSPNIGQVTSIGKVTCPRCDAVASDHERVIRGEWQSIETENLMALFRELGYPAANIQSIYIYAEGHSFDSEISEVQLLGSE